MLYFAFASLILTVVLMILSVLFKVAGKLRLSLPLLYFLLICTFLNKWAAANEKLAFTILFVLIGFSVLSWIISLKNKIQEKKYYQAMEEDMSWQVERARKHGIPLDTVHFDAQGNMRYNDSNDIVE